MDSEHKNATSLITMDFYYTIETSGTAEYKDRGSKFLAYAFNISNKEDFKLHLQTLKKEHPKAAHHCFAYRIGYNGNNFRVSDGGEPSGTAGKQILAQMDSKNLCDILIIVVRYFGGTLLGIPGLINAYKTATALVLQCTQVIKRSIEVEYTIQFNYTEMNDVMRILKQYSATVISAENQLFSTIKAGIPKNKLEEVLQELQNIKHVEVIEQK